MLQSGHRLLCLPSTSTLTPHILGVSINQPGHITSQTFQHSFSSTRSVRSGVTRTSSHVTQKGLPNNIDKKKRHALPSPSLQLQCPQVRIGHLVQHLRMKDDAHPCSSTVLCAFSHRITASIATLILFESTCPLDGNRHSEPQLLHANL